MRNLSSLALVLVLSLSAAACSDVKPPISGRMRGPSGLATFTGCPQNTPGCNRSEEGHHLLLVTNSQGDDVRVFDTYQRAFFSSISPFFPLSIPVGLDPKGVAVDPYGEWAVVANQLSQDVSLINLAPNRLVEVDTDGDPSTVAASLNCPEVPNQIEDPTNDRCLAGVSRVSLGPQEELRPESIAIPKGVQGDPAIEAWPRQQPLPVWVSLPAAGRVALLTFHYPQDGGPQLLRFQESIEVGGIPSGLAIRADGSRLYAADEDSSSVVVVDTATFAVVRVEVGGPTRRVFLSPDEQVLYAVRLDDSRIALIDTATNERRPAYSDEAPEARDPEGDGLDIVLPGIAREITFVQGRSVMVSDESLSPTTYPLGQDPITNLAFVSDMNGNVYILDAQRHGSIDVMPLVGPTAGQPALSMSGEIQSQEDLLACVTDGGCPLPNIADFDRTAGMKSEVTGEEEQDPTLYHGFHLRPGATRSEGWILTWEGILPGSAESTSGHFTGWQLDDERVRIDFTGLGIEVGDVLEVLTAPAPDPDGSGAYNPACVPDSGSDPRKEFSITAVDTNSLSLQPVAGMDPGVCWPTAVRYNLRAKGAWTVAGTVSGSYPRLHMVPWQDPPPDPPVYDNGQFAVTMFEPGPDEQGNPRKVPRDSSWGFSTESGFTPATFTPSIQAGMSGPILAIDMDNGADEVRTEDDPLYGLVGPADDRIYLLFEGSNALMEFFPGALQSTNYLLYQ